MCCGEKSGSGSPVTFEKVSLMGSKKNACYSKLNVFRYHGFDYKAHPTAFSLNPVMARIQLMINEGIFATGVSGIFPILFYLGFCHAKPKCIIGEHRTVFIYHVSAVVILILLSAPLAWQRLKTPQALMKLQFAVYERFVLHKKSTLIGLEGYDALPSKHSGIDINNSLDDFEFIQKNISDITKIKQKLLTFCCFQLAQTKATLLHKFVHIVFYVIPYNVLLYYILALISGVYQDARTGKANDPTDISFIAWCIVGVCTLINVIVRYKYDSIMRDINASLKRIDLMLAQAFINACEKGNLSSANEANINEMKPLSLGGSAESWKDSAAKAHENKLVILSSNIRSCYQGCR